MKAFPFQRKTIYSVERKFDGRALIGNVMGLGKTPTSLWFVKRKRLGDTLPLLVVLPKIVRGQWIQAIQDILGICPDVLETRTPPRGKRSFNSPVAVINYDIIAYWRDYLESRDFQTIIVDECQRCTNPKAKRTKVTTAIMKQTPFALALSGTPLSNRPIELFPIINALHPKEWPNRGLFGHRYCGAKYTRWGWDFKGSSNIGELNARLKQTCMVRYLKEEVALELPEKLRTIIPVELSDPEEYTRAKNDFVGWMKSNYPDRLNKAIKALTLSKAGHLLRLAARLKMKQVVEWINYRLEQDSGKIVVFAVHRKCVEALSRRIKAKSAVVNGSVVGRHRDAAISQFHNDSKTRVFIGNTAAAGVGLNLNIASTLCMTELMLMPGPLLQAEDRIHRIGQTSTCWVYYFIGQGTIEESVSKLIQRKQKIITGVLDGEDTEEDFDIYNQLLEELEHESPNLRGPRLDKPTIYSGFAPFISTGNGNHRRGSKRSGLHC